MGEILTSIHGRDVGLDANRNLVSRKGIASGDSAGQMFLPSADRVTMFDDFVGAAQVYGTTIVDGMWRSRKGTTNAVDFTTGTGIAGGVAAGTVGDTTASMAASGVQLDSGRVWLANQGELYMEFRARTSIITNLAWFIGLTDQVSALEMPIESAASANTITTTATDAVGIMFDTEMTSDNWWAVGVADGTDATHVDTGYAPVASVFRRWGIHIDTSGNARFFRSGVQVAYVALAVTPTIALTPVVAAFNRTTTGNPVIQVDYIHVSALR